MYRNTRLTGKIDPLWAIVSALLLACLVLAGRVSAGTGSPEFRHGTVAARGFVLNAAGYPVWVTYNEDGDVTFDLEIEASGVWADAEVMSRAAFTARRQALGLSTCGFTDATGSVLASHIQAACTDIHGSADNIGLWSEFYTQEGDEKTWWGPVEGAQITAFDGRFPSRSDENGAYVVRYYIPPCPCFTMPYDHRVYAELRYQYFNPKSDRLGSYFVSRPAYDYCSGLSECPHDYNLMGMLTQLAVKEIEGEMKTNKYRHLDIPVDVAVLSGTATLNNTRREAIEIDPNLAGTLPVGPTTYQYVQPAYEPKAPEDIDGDGVEDTVHHNADGTMDVWLSSSGADPASDPPSLTGVSDVDPDLFDRGLAEAVSAEDRQNTDVYAFRVSNDQLISFRRGLGTHEMDGEKFTYRFLFRGPGDRVNQSAGDLEAYQAKSNLPESMRGFAADHLRTGEKIKVIMINRATGYIGSSVGTFGENTGQGLISFHPPPIVMRPPNLKIRAERTYDVPAGLTQDEERNYLIGFEGSGLTSDTFVVVRTEWTAWDGGALPEDLPGYTGRLAKVVSAEGPNSDQLSQIANFEVKPGLNTVVVRLKEENVDNAHFYLHVSGEPGDRTPSFAEVGGGAGALAYRPDRYVPIQVPVYDPMLEAENLTGEGTATAESDADPEPPYRWVYRPEMKFTLFDLEAEADTGEMEDEAEADPTLPYSYGQDIGLIYSLISGDIPALPGFGPQQPLVFNIGGQEILATLEADGSVHFENIDTISALDGDDYLTLRLYQNGDDPNTLWEYATPQIEVGFVRPESTGCRLMQGDSLVLEAKTLPAGRPVSWEFLASGSDAGVRVHLDPRGDTALISALEDTASGWVLVRVRDRLSPRIYTDKLIHVGCQNCAECDTIGGGDFKLDGVNARFSLGTIARQVPAGDLFIRADTPTTELGTPAALILSKGGDLEDGEKVQTRLALNPFSVDGDQQLVLRQVIAPEALVDIVPLDATSYELNYYSSYTLPDKGLATASGSPFVTWRVEGGAGSLTVTEIRGGSSTTYTYTGGAGTLSLTRGNGQLTEHRQESISGSDLDVTTWQADDHGQRTADTTATYRTYAFGQAVAEQVVDPGGENLTTTYTYYEDPSQAGSFGKLAERTDPTGAVTTFTYDIQGRTTAQTHTWLDTVRGTAARSLTYTYAPVVPGDAQSPDDKYRPRTVTETIAGTPVSRTYYGYYDDALGNRVEITERCAAPAAALGTPGNLRTVTSYGEVDGPAQGRLIKSQEPGGRLTTITYEPAANGGETITTVHGTTSSPDGIANRTQREVATTDAQGRELRRETQVYTGSGYETLSWQTRTYDDQGHLIGTTSSDGTTTTSHWDCCNKDSDTDARGITTTYIHDDLDRLTTLTRHLATGAIATTYTYDAAGRTLTTTTSAGGLTSATATTYDAAGRVKTTTDPTGRTTDYDYSEDGLTTTITRPGGFTEITTRYLGGRTKSVTGSGVVARYYAYGINPDGSQWTRVNTGAPDSPEYELTTSDTLGRTISTQRPGFNGPEITTQHYDAAGRLVRTTAPGMADTLYDYDELGEQYRNGLDIDADGTLTPASTDRITDTLTDYFRQDGSWWQRTTSKIYPNDNDATSVTTNVQRQRISGLGDGTIAQSVTIDIHGKVTVARTELDPATQAETRTINHPDATIDAVATTISGQLTSSRSKTGVTTTYGYDALGRRTSTSDGRTTTTTHYDDRGQVEWTQDAENNRTTYGYDKSSGRMISQTNALTHTTRYAYNGRGQVTATWGTGVYPTAYEYDTAGRMTAMHTYRSEQGFDGESFPIDPIGDTTRWHYHPASGLLSSKEYADHSEVTYTYHPGGRLETRTWARGTTTTYTYDPATAELTTIDYSDATADISFTYDRLGRQKEILDAAGTRSFGYNAYLQLETETLTGLVAATLTRSYEQTGVPGRADGIRLDDGYTIGYGFEPATGRFQNISWSAQGRSDSLTYTYLRESDLLETLTTPSGRATTYTYEPHRNLKTGVENAFNTVLISDYAYLYDPIGRRSSVTYTGGAFSQDTFSRYGYNDRSELTNSDRYLGTDPNDLTSPVPAEQRAYQYDPIGNRTQSTAAGKATGYVPNSLNQYVQLTGATTFSPTYDADGNMQTTPDGMRYTYNGENRLITVEPQSPDDGDTRVEFVYDYMGRRVQKTVYTYASSTFNRQFTQQFTYDGWNMVRETTLSYAQPDTNTHYVWGLDLSQSLQGAGGVGGLLAAVHPNAAYHYCIDGNGNVGQLVDGGDGSVAGRYEYDPFGKLVRSDGDLAYENIYRFSTKQYCTKLNLYYYGYRYFCPKLGRWSRADPLKEPGNKLLRNNDFEDNLDDINLYIFINNSVVNGIDIVGLDDWMEFQKCKQNHVWMKKPNGIIPPADACSAPGFLAGSPSNPGWWLDIDFSSACNKHDYCYSNCLKTRKQCDSDFRTNLELLCIKYAKSRYQEGTWWQRHKKKVYLQRCDEWAYDYYRGVRLGGRNPYRNRQEKNCHCSCPIMLP